MSTMQQEQWVIPTYNGISYTNYLISTSGRLVSKSKYSRGNPKITLQFGDYSEVKPLKCKAGYLTYNIYQTPDTRNLIYGHRLMWESFVCPITSGMVIDHINNERNDNRLVNIQMITQSENLIKAYSTGRRTKKSNKK